VGVASLPKGCDLSWFGLDPSRVSMRQLIRTTANHELYRLTTKETAYVLKWFSPGPTANEVSSYQLLQKFRVPTIPVVAITDRGVLMVDLACSGEWRLGGEEDLSTESTGSAVAAWYRRLHDAGSELAHESAFPTFLRRQSDQVKAASLRAAGERFDVSSLPSWRRALDHYEELVTALQALPETLNHNDFHHTTLVLSRHLAGGDQAIVFDYDLLGVGPRVCDYRNVTTGLGSSASRSFAETYGPLTDGELALDAPVAVLAALVTAARRRHLPAWALPLRHELTSGAFDRKLAQALAVINC